MHNRESCDHRLPIPVPLTSDEVALQGRRCVIPWQPERYFLFRPMGPLIGLNPAGLGQNGLVSEVGLNAGFGLVTGESGYCEHAAGSIHTREVAGSKPAAPMLRIARKPA